VLDYPRFLVQLFAVNTSYLRVILLSLHLSWESIYETQYNSLAEYEWIKMSVNSLSKVKGHLRKNSEKHFMNNFARKGTHKNPVQESISDPTINTNLLSLEKDTNYHFCF
jgi:hypothetical protein